MPLNVSNEPYQLLHVEMGEVGVELKLLSKESNMSESAIWPLCQY